jgi:hypothetical protein
MTHENRIYKAAYGHVLIARPPVHAQWPAALSRGRLGRRSSWGPLPRCDGRAAFPHPGSVQGRCQEGVEGEQRADGLMVQAFSCMGGQGSSEAEGVGGLAIS